MKSIYEQAGGTYTRQGDYELPNLKVSLEKEIEIGVWGQTIPAIFETVPPNLVLQPIDRRNAERTSGRYRSAGGADVSVACIHSFRAEKCHGKAESQSSYGMGAKGKQHPKPSR